MHDTALSALIRRVKEATDYFLDFEVCYRKADDIEDEELALSRREYLKEAIEEAEKLIRSIKEFSLDFRVSSKRFRFILKPLVDLKMSMESEITITTAYLRRRRLIHGAPGRGSRSSRNGVCYS